MKKEMESGNSGFTLTRVGGTSYFEYRPTAINDNRKSSSFDWSIVGDVLAGSGIIGLFGLVALLENARAKWLGSRR